MHHGHFRGKYVSTDSQVFVGYLGYSSQWSSDPCSSSLKRVDKVKTTITTKKQAKKL